MHATILRAWITLIILAIIPVGYAWGKEGAPSSVNPLLPADTSSPRATLRSFLIDADFYLRSTMSGEVTSQDIILARQRAAATLDFSNTPNGNLTRIQIERIGLLKEVLDRIALPEEGSIPGSAEVADGAIASWAVPGTDIRIARVESGPRKGEFLFSAATVEKLLRLYRLAKNLPYQPGATPGAYDFVVQRRADSRIPAGGISRRLRPVDTSTPRTVVQEFLNSVNQAYALVMRAEAEWRATPRVLTIEKAQRLDTEARQLIDRAATALDLSDVPEARQQDVATEAVLQLKEILDRLPLPPINGIPDALNIAAQREAQETPAPIRWRIPNTPLEIVEMPEGNHQGEFLLSAHSVSLLGDLYRQVAHLPYREDVSYLEIGYASADLSPDFYSYFTASTGHLVPYSSRLGTLLSNLPPWLMSEYNSQTVWQWLGLVVTVLFVVAIALLIFQLVRRLGPRMPNPIDEWTRLLVPLAVAGLVNITVDFIGDELNITGNVHAFVVTTSGYIEYLLYAFAVFLFFRAAAETIIERAPIGTRTIDASLVRLSAKVIGFLAAVYVIVAGARSLGADLVPLIAGLGVGGLAVALAAQKTLANIIGSIILFAERPVREGDFFHAGDLSGTVERIGLHSTRVRTPERTIVTVPNAQFSEMLINNFSRRDRRLFKTVLPLSEDTTTVQMKGILDDIQALLSQHPKVLPEPRVRFIGFGDYSEDVEIFAYLDCVDQTDFLTIQEELLMRIEEIIIAAGSGFALPSQITEIKGTLVPAVDEPTEK